MDANRCLRTGLQNFSLCVPSWDRDRDRGALSALYGLFFVLPQFTTSPVRLASSYVDTTQLYDVAAGTARMSIRVAQLLSRPAFVAVRCRVNVSNV